MLPFTPLLKQRRRIASQTAIRRPLPTPARAMSIEVAMVIARSEITRLGLAATHHISALYAGEDRHAEGAAFALIVRERSPGPAAGHCPPGAPRLKLLIHKDGHIAVQTVTH